MLKKTIILSLIIPLSLGNSCSTIIKNTGLAEKKLVDTYSEPKSELTSAKINYSQDLEKGKLKITLKKENIYSVNQVVTQTYARDLPVGWKIGGGIASFALSVIGLGLIPVWNGDRNTDTAIIAGGAAALTVADLLVNNFLFKEEKISQVSPVNEEQKKETENLDNAFVTLSLGNRIFSGTTDKNGSAYFLPEIPAGFSEDNNVVLSINDKGKNYKLEFPLENDIYSYLSHGAKQAADNTPPYIVITYPEIKRGVVINSREEKITVMGKVMDESGVANVTVNGNEAVLMQDGSFRAEINLIKGENPVTVVAEDNNKNRANKIFQIAWDEQNIASKASISSSSSYDDRIIIKGSYYALLIGINKYRALPELETAENDAGDISELLKKNYGFKTTLLLGKKATRSNIMNELNEIRKKLAPEDKLLIYFAGHGTFDSQTGKAYWLPVDAEDDNDTDWIMADLITSNLKRISAKHVLIVSDSCYSGTLSRGFNPDLSSFQTRVNYINKILDKETRILISSGGNEPVSDSGGEKHSVFAQALLSGLKNMNDNVFTAEELFVKQLRETVAGKSEQTPEYKIITNSGHDGGDFVFRKR